MIQDLGLSVLQQACNQLRQWQRLPDYETLRISVNLSAKQLFHSDLVTKVADIIAASRIDPTHLKLELTESTIIRNDQTTINLLKQLRELGLELYLDDFGAGYSSLSYLYSLPINALKIDQTFVQRIDMGAEGQAIIRSILLLANNLDLQVVAEGVENKIQLNYLNSLNCTHGQGFLLPHSNGEGRDILVAIARSIRVPVCLTSILVLPLSLNIWRFSGLLPCHSTQIFHCSVPLGLLVFSLD